MLRYVAAAERGEVDAPGLPTSDELSIERASLRATAPPCVRSLAAHARRSQKAGGAGGSSNPPGPDPGPDPAFERPEHWTVGAIAPLTVQPSGKSGPVWAVAVFPSGAGPTLRPMPLCFIEPQEAIRVVAESVGREARRQLLGEVVRAWVDEIPDDELHVHYAKAVDELDDDDLSMLAAWHASLEVGQPVANKEFLLKRVPIASASTAVRP